MKTPTHPCIIHVIEAKYVVHVAVPRPSIWVRARTYLVHGLTNARRGLVHSGRVARFLVTALVHRIICVGLHAVNGIRCIHFVSITWLTFVFLTIPLFVIGLFFLLTTLAWAWGLIEALSRAFSHLPHP